MPYGLRFAVGVGLLTACGAGERQAPDIADLVIEKAPDNSGDRQVGVAGKPLQQDFRARVTRDGKPVEGVTVYWTTMQGSMNPASDITDADGITASRWTTMFFYGEQEAFASLEPVTGPRVPGSPWGWEQIDGVHPTPAASASSRPGMCALLFAKPPPVRRVGDIELVDSNTARATHHVSPASGPAYAETSVRLRDQQ
jgi:hypothetical protein